MPLFKVEPRGVLNGIAFPNAAPLFKPVSEGTVIDVKGDFSWALQKNLSRVDVPTLFLREQLVEISSALQNFRYAVGNNAPLLVGKFAGEQFLSKVVGGAAGSAGRGASLTGKAAAVAVGAGAGLATRALQNPLNKLTGTGANKEYLEPYGGLYQTKETGFKYALPYLETAVENISNSWALQGEEFKGVSSGEPGVTSSSEKLADLLNKVGAGGQSDMTSLISNIAAAAYNEKPRTWSYDAQFNFSVRFPLYNTVDWENTKKNFEFVTLLTYQNLPNRLSPTLLDPPVIYEAYVPGILYTPYCYISSLNIKSIGSTRDLKMPLAVVGTNATLSNLNLKQNALQNVNVKPARNVGGTVPEGADNIEISALIPDAYEVEITFASVVGKSQNLKYQALMSGDSNDGFSVGLPNAFTSAVRGAAQGIGAAG